VDHYILEENGPRPLALWLVDRHAYYLDTIEVPKISAEVHLVKDEIAFPYIAACMVIDMICSACEPNAV
jgi:hypothetical protein